MTEEQKYLYIIDFWVPFPSSEYGGLLNVIASNDQECFDLLSKENTWWVEDTVTGTVYAESMMQNIIQAQKFKLTDDYESGIIEAFCT
jgi:hypothetical protein